MSIEFLLSEFEEKKKKELVKIDKQLSKKPRKRNRNALFLRNFTLSLMGQYKVKKHHFQEKRKNMDFLNTEIALETQRTKKVSRPIQRIMPKVPNQMIKPQARRQVRPPTPTRTMRAPSPSQVKIEMPPTPSNVTMKTPSPKVEIPTPIETPKPVLKVPKPEVVPVPE